MSRMRGPALLLLAVPGWGQADTTAMMTHYQTVTSVVVRTCAAPRTDREIVVCARRQADRYRIPFVGYEAGDPRAETVSAERNRLASTPRTPCGQGAIIANCGGGVGLHASVGFGAGGVGPLRLRPLGVDTD